MNLTDLLRSENFDPKQVFVLRHRPSEPELNKVLPWLAAEKLTCSMRTSRRRARNFRMS
jgi:hypothetical protein